MSKKVRGLIGMLAASAMLAATATPAFAGGRYHGGYHHGYKSGFHDGFRKSHRYYGHGRHYGHRRHHDRGLGRTGAAVLGVMGGLVIGSIIADSQRRHYQRPQPVYVPVAQPVAVPEPAYNPNLPSASGQGQCLQTREYQTVVVIGGAEREAYGTACLQPDGSWLKGPLQVAP